METENKIVEVRFDLSSDHIEDIKAALYTLNICNEKITKLESSRFYKKFYEEEFTVLMKFGESLKTTKSRKEDDGSISISLTGAIESSLPIFDQDNVDAFALTYRQLIQDNDQISIRNIYRKIYNAEWMFDAAKDNFEYLRNVLNQYLDSAIFLQLYKNGTIARRQLVDIILYGGLAHTDTTKETIFRSWMDSGLSGFFWAEFYETMISVMRTILTIREVNQNIIKIFNPLVTKLEEGLAAERAAINGGNQ